MGASVMRIYHALMAGEKMAVYGDFDVDGISATALMVKGIAALGGDVQPYIPHRLQEGHGLNSMALNELLAAGIRLVITVDCGVTGVAEVAGAKDGGMEVIVTDHHLPGETLPIAAGVIDPHREDSFYPFRELSGAGVAYKLLAALYRSAGRESQVEDYLDLVALGTVADMVSLTGENRFLVKKGLEKLRSCRRVGIREMVAQAGLTLEKLTEEHISWVLSPRLNAAGRLDHSNTSYRLLVTDSAEEARVLATELGELNRERQKLTASAFTHAREQVLSNGIGSLLVASHDDYPGGVLGLVAGKLTDEFRLPAVVIQLGEEISHASCRSIPEFNISQAIAACGELLSRWGGHSQAAGMAIPTRNLPELVRKLNDIAMQQLEHLDLRPSLEIDARLALSELSLDLFHSMQRLAPFGQDNPVPLFLSRGVMLMEMRAMGSDGRHLRLKIKEGKCLRDAVAFDVGTHSLKIGMPLDIVYNFELDEWNGEKNLRLNIRDYADSQTETV